MPVGATAIVAEVVRNRSQAHSLFRRWSGWDFRCFGCGLWGKDREEEMLDKLWANANFQGQNTMSNEPSWEALQFSMRINICFLVWSSRLLSRVRTVAIWQMKKLRLRCALPKVTKLLLKELCLDPLKSHAQCMCSPWSPLGMASLLASCGVWSLGTHEGRYFWARWSFEVDEISAPVVVFLSNGGKQLVLQEPGWAISNRWCGSALSVGWSRRLLPTARAQAQWVTWTELAQVPTSYFSQKARLLPLTPFPPLLSPEPLQMVPTQVFHWEDADSLLATPRDSSSSLLALWVPYGTWRCQPSPPRHSLRPSAPWGFPLLLHSHTGILVCFLCFAASFLSSQSHRKHWSSWDSSPSLPLPSVFHLHNPLISQLQGSSSYLCTDTPSLCLQLGSPELLHLRLLPGPLYSQAQVIVLNVLLENPENGEKVCWTWTGGGKTRKGRLSPNCGGTQKPCPKSFMHLGFRIRNRGFWAQRNYIIAFRKVDWTGLGFYESKRGLRTSQPETRGAASFGKRKRTVFWVVNWARVRVERKRGRGRLQARLIADLATAVLVSAP